MRAHHDRSPGRQSAGSELTRLGDGRTSYGVVADHVAGAERVLDLGCADGWLLELLAGRGVRTLAGVDLSGEELAIAYRRPALREVGADLRQGRAQELPWADESFDAVVAHMSLMLMSDADQVAAEVARVLAPGGVFVATVGGGPVPGGVVELFGQVARKYLSAVPADRRLPRIGDKRTRGRDGLVGVLSPAGLDVVGWESGAVERACTAVELWDEFSTSYGMEMLDAEQTALRRAEFLERAVEVTRPDGRVSGGMVLNTCVARRVA